MLHGMRSLAPTWVSHKLGPFKNVSLVVFCLGSKNFSELRFTKQRASTHPMGLEAYMGACLKPGPAGEEAVCVPHGSPPCCVGLECLPDPKNSSFNRCSNKYEDTLESAPGGSAVKKLWHGVALADAPDNDGVRVIQLLPYVLLVVALMVMVRLSRTFAKTIFSQRGYLKDPNTQQPADYGSIRITSGYEQG